MENKINIITYLPINRHQQPLNIFCFGFLILFSFFAKAQNTPTPTVQSLTWLEPNVEDFGTTPKTVYIEGNVFSFEILYKANRKLEDNEFTIYLNGKPYQHEKSDNVSFVNGNRFSGKVKLSEIENKIYITAGDKKTVEVVVSRSLKKPTMHLVVVGVEGNGLNFPSSDAESVMEMFKIQAKEGGFYNIIPYYIKSIEADRANIIKIIKGIRDNYIESNPNDIFVLYLSSHGELKNGNFYFHCTRFGQEVFNDATISNIDLDTLLKPMKCKKLVFIDACRSDVNAPKTDDSHFINKAIESLSENIDADAYFMSCRDKERSFECDSLKMATFTYALIQGLEYGKADVNNDSIITVQEIADYVESETPKVNAICHTRAIQHPFTNIANELKKKPFFHFTGKHHTTLKIRDSLEVADEYFDKLEYKSAIQLYKSRQEHLTAEQKYRLGNCIWEIDKKDKPKAMELFKEAAEAGNPNGQFEMGQEAELQNNITSAKEYYQKAANQGHKQAEERLKRLEMKYPEN